MLKLIKEMVSLRNFVKHFPDILLSQYVSHLWDLTLIMVILFMAKQIMKVPIKKIKELNIMLLLSAV